MPELSREVAVLGVCVVACLPILTGLILWIAYQLQK